jgi:hypothetical protein
MPKPIFAAVLAALCAGFAGCSETTQRLDGLTPGAGDAIAANTAMQMVDPWQYGVQNTDLSVPADRTGVQAAADSSGSSSSSSSSDSSSSSSTTTN